MMVKVEILDSALILFLVISSMILWSLLMFISLNILISKWDWI